MWVEVCFPIDDSVGLDMLTSGGHKGSKFFF